MRITSLFHLAKAQPQSYSHLRRQTMRKYIMTATVAIGICVGFTIWFISFAQPSNASQETPKQTMLSKLPPIKNCVEHVKLVKAELVMQGESQAAALELENTAYVGIVSISLDQTANKTTNGVTRSGFTPDKPPIVIIAPGEKQTITFGNLDGNSPLRIGAAIFSDGTEEGCAGSLRTIHAVKTHDIKGRPPQ